MNTLLHRQATRRVPLGFDDKGEPTFKTVCSPVGFSPRAHGVLPPRHVIPIIFVPGIMGTNLRMTREADPKQLSAWTPPNGIFAGLDEVRRRRKQTPDQRQLQLAPARTEVDDRGQIALPDSLYTLTEKEARRRGWGEVHHDSYGGALAELERALNDQYEEPGRPGSKKLPVWTIAQTLKKQPPARPRAEGGPQPADEAVEDPIDVLGIWNPIKGDIAALTDAEFARLDDFYYPVWACGYNWLESNEASADRLLRRIDEALAWYEATRYFIPQGKVIVVTHSMGGLVARRAAQKAADKILGVVHGVQPVGGAPVVYRRFRAGTETGGFFDIAGAAVATIIGWDAADITCVMANAPGPLELLPTKHYPPGWLTISHEVDGKQETLATLPQADPYEEIYAKRVQDVWWGMIDETLIDPAGLAQKNNKTPIGFYQDSLDAAKAFHDTVGLYSHPNTYAHYGSDRRQIAFGGIHWVTSDTVPEALRTSLLALPARSWTRLGKTQVLAGDRTVTFKTANRRKPESDAATDAGDGTVPSPSGAVIGKSDGAAHVFCMKGFDHQGSYSHPDVLDNVMYCLAKIIQKATPAKDLPQHKEGEPTPCPDSTQGSPESAPPSSVLSPA